MKPLARMAFVGLYLLLTAGVQVLIHTCGDFTSYTILPSSAKDPCGCADVGVSDDGCCTVALATIQIVDDQSFAHAVSVSRIDVVSMAAVVEFSDPASRLAGRPAFFTDTSPPPVVPLTILHCTFLV